MWGLGAALHEHAVSDPGWGCFVNRDLADDDAPSHADIPAIEIHFLPELDDKTPPLTIKGVGELGIYGAGAGAGAAGAAVVNAVFNACGVRMGDFPLPWTRCWPAWRAPDSLGLGKRLHRSCTEAAQKP